MNDKWKHVVVGDCFKILIFALVMLCIVFVPFSFATEDGLVFTFKKLPIVGDGSVKNVFQTEMGYIANVLPSLNEGQLDLFQTIFTYAFYAYFVILVLDFLFAFVLMIFRVRVMRIIFCVFSKIFAILMIIIALCSLIFIGVNVYAAIKGLIEFNYMVYTSGITTMIVMLILSIIICVKQFSFFSKPYDLD